MLDDAYKLIESLRAELFKSRAETQEALGEKERAESKLIHAKLKLEQMRATQRRTRSAWRINSTARER